MATCWRMTGARVTLRVLACACAVVLCASLWAQPARAQVESPWSVYESVQGSFNSAGQLFKVDTSVAYQFTEFFEMGGGLPVYLVRSDDRLDPLGQGWNAGVGNAYLDLRLMASGDAWYLSSGVRGSAPTGDRDRGFSTGKVAVDWTNSLAVYLPHATLFGSAGVANTVSDTSFFVRPFTTSGLVADFDAGVFLPIGDRVGLGFLGYVVEGGGEQQVISRLIDADRPPGSDTRRGFETTVESRGEDLADDHGFSTWFDISSGSDVNFQVGYSRSVPYAYDTAFFSIGFDVISLMR